MTPYLSPEDEKTILNWIDKIIEFLPEYEKDIFGSIAAKIECRENPFIVHNIEQTMRRLNIFEGEQLIQFSDFGREVKKVGNYSKYLAQKEIEISREKQKNLLEIENLEYSILMNKWLLRTKWLPHFLSLLALIMAIISLYSNK